MEKILNEDPKCHSDYQNMGLLIEPIMKILSKLNLRVWSNIATFKNFCF